MKPETCFQIDFGFTKKEFPHETYSPSVREIDSLDKPGHFFRVDSFEPDVNDANVERVGFQTAK